jgi:hypothetical protein
VSAESKFVFVTSAAECLEAVDAWSAAHKAWGEQARALIASWGLDGVPVTNSHRWVGVSHEYGQAIPGGWRQGDGKGMNYVQPYRSKNPGKKMAKALDEHSKVPNLAETMPGMSSFAFVGFSWMTPGFNRWKDRLWCVWSQDPRSAWGEKNSAGPQWEPGKLSEFYADLEEREAAHA